MKTPRSSGSSDDELPEIPKNLASRFAEADVEAWTAMAEVIARSEGGIVVAFHRSTRTNRDESKSCRAEDRRRAGSAACSVYEDS